MQLDAYMQICIYAIGIKKKEFAFAKNEDNFYGLNILFNIDMGACLKPILLNILLFIFLLVYSWTPFWPCLVS